MNKTFGDVKEEQNWQAFVDNYDEIRPSAQMPDGCYTCKVGSRWSEWENETLIEMVRPGVTLEDMARRLNRSFLGIVGRLQLMGIMRAEDSRYDNFHFNRFVSYKTMAYRYKETRKLCCDMVPFMEANWERLGWEKTNHGFYLPHELRDQKVEKGRFNASWKRRTEPERMKKKIEAAKQAGDIKKANAIMREERTRERRRDNPVLTKSGRPDRRFKYQ